MKILMTNERAWDKSNSFGSTYDNIFSDINNLEFFFVRRSFSGKDYLENCHIYQITERSLLQNIFNKKIPSGHEVKKNENKYVDRNDIEKKIFNFSRVLRFQIFFWARDCIWKIGRWKTEDLDRFIKESKADLIFQPIGEKNYANDMINYIKLETDLPMIGYISDDCYTLNQFSLSPLYWINRIIVRRKVKRSIEQCSLLYVVSDMQKREYEKIFNVKCKVLTKSVDFSTLKYHKTNLGNKTKLFYAGIINKGRLESLAIISNAVKQLNEEGYDITLNINTQSPITSRMIRLLNISDCCILGSTLSSLEVLEMQKKSNVLLHVEGLSLKERKTVRLSFSTKLVDYFSLGKAIFAFGPEEVASIGHLMANNAAQVATSRSEVYPQLKQLVTDTEYRDSLGHRAFECGQRNHSKSNMRDMLLKDMLYVIECRSKES